VKQAFRELGASKEPPDVEIKSFFGELHEIFMDWVMSYGLKCDRQTAAKRIDELELEKLKEKGEVFPGIVQMLGALRSIGCITALCSNGRSHYVTAVMDKCGLWPYFDTVKYRTKPDDNKPRLLRELIEEYPGKRTVLVGDRRFDFEAARMAGCSSIGVSFGYGGDELALADVVVDKPSQILEVILARESIFEVISSRIAHVKVSKRAVTVGITGTYQAGKTEFAKGLSSFLERRGFKARFIHFDDIHGEVDSGESSERAVRELMDTPSDDVRVVEGLHVGGKRIAQYIDCLVWLDITREECMKRAEKRNHTLHVSRQHWEKKLSTYREFIRKNRPRERADLVVDNNTFLWPKLVP